MTITNPLDLDHVVLKKSAHPQNDTGDWCVMEAVAYVAGERWSDSPECASPVLGAFLRSWNDTLDDEHRQQLVQYIPRLVGSKGTPEQEDARAWMAMDWLVRTYTPRWLRLAKLDGQAVLLEQLPEFKASMSVPSVKPVIESVRQDAQAAWAAAWAAAGDAAGDAARVAARDAAWDAAGAAARVAAWAAAWDAARVAARVAAWAAAGDAARVAARVAAWDAARAAARVAAWDAARDAARAALAPTVEALQADAHQLVDRMLAVTGS